MADTAADENNVYVEVNTPGAASDGAKSGNGTGLPFTPSNLCIKDLEYFVTLPSGGRGETASARHHGAL
ncbi:hypothetical protein PF005_g15807 [Phytophthora fragariae]|uniref:Uncharacterized protein n=1 Tax=Phytophthora fragariae TaxID=53985 RepID=A0A6A3TG07_9STRA|nr:hypothetical protein PF003_g11022 [Phytophthora fragariae]KAE8932657.1 hypothetical protein PF009_g17325 [Phytophthora fragariae]KAE8999021.1 hypothetical protein PF011_g14800 [Phytophthora fragariae]KAE9093638.1 hypothetical protein PF010_g17405 [Phytophthora fragariae]KAE9096581.1 hypothetical protein PF007_g16949 [Phytophthora fragariae]